MRGTGQQVGEPDAELRGADLSCIGNSYKPEEEGEQQVKAQEVE